MQRVKTQTLKHSLLGNNLEKNSWVLEVLVLLCGYPDDTSTDSLPGCYLNTWFPASLKDRL